MVGDGLWRRCRVVVVLGVLMVLVAAVSIPAFADGGAQHGPGQGPVDWDAVEPPDMSRMFTDRAYLDSAAQALAQTASAEREHGSADERQARDASESRFADLSGASAQDLAQREFPELMGEDLDTLAVPAGSHLKSFLSPTVARVVDSAGKGSLLVGSKPLAAQDASGDLKAIDLTLQSSGDAYVPADPAADVSIPRTADDYLQLGDQGLGLRPSDAPATAGMREDDRVFYPEVAADTDFVSMPTRTGAEVMWQLRSAQAGEELALDLDLPDGASARLTSSLTAPVGQTASPAGAAVEVVRDGAVIDTISPPLAADADGVSVAVSYRLDGGRLVVEVPHRALDVKYPIIVDPDVVETYAGVDFSGNCAGGGWYIQSWGQRMNTYCNDTSRGGGGLWIQSNNQAYDNDSRTQWVWSVPNYVHIDSVWIDGVWVHSSGTHMYAGIVGPSGRWNSPPLNLGDDRMNDQFRMNASNGADNMNSFAMGLYEDCCWGGTPRPSIAWAGFNGVQISLGDGVAPWGVRLWGSSQNIDVAPMEGYGMHYGTSRWIRSDGTYTLNLDAHDDGLGLKGIGTGKMVPRSTWDLANDTGLDSAILSGAVPNTCTGNRAGPCPMSATPVGQPLDLSGQHGIIGLHTFATDIVGNTGHGNAYFVKVDHDPPNVTLSGPATAADGVGANPTIHVQVTDGSNASPSTMQSGVRAAITNLFDPTGAFVRGWTWTNPQTDITDNDAGLDYTLPTAMNGTYKLTVDAFDDVGYHAVATRYFTVVAYPTSWNYDRNGDRQITTSGEVQAVLDAMENAASEAAASSIFAGLSPADQDRVSSAQEDEDEGVAGEAVDTGDETYRSVTADLVRALRGDPARVSLSTGIWDDIQTQAQSCDMMAAIMLFEVCDRNNKPINPPEWVAWVNKTLDGTTKSYPSAALRVELGSPPPDSNGATFGWAAHHIVAAWNQRAIWTRMMMVKCGIKPNDPRNGIYLRGPKRYASTSGYTQLAQTDRITAPHKGPFVHTVHQFEVINRRLLNAVRDGGCRTDVADRNLADIRSALRSGAVPGMPGQ